MLQTKSNLEVHEQLLNVLNGSLGNTFLLQLYQVK